MTAPTINGVKYPQPVDALLPKARKLMRELGELPSRNRLMREYRIGAPKADELRTRLREEHLRRQLADQFGYTPPSDRNDQENEPATLDPPAMVKATIDLAAQRGHVPTADELADEYGISPNRAAALRNLVSLARQRAGLPVDQEPTGITQDESTPAPWLYAEPIGPDPLPDPSEPGHTRPVEPSPATPVESTPAETYEQVRVVGHPGTPTPVDPPAPRRTAVVWPVVLLALPAFVAVWSGWVGLGSLTGFGVVHPLPGIWDTFSINSAITLPIGVETYGAYALYVWLSGRGPDRARRFARWSAIASLLVGALGQIAYHLLVAAGVTAAPWWITTAVACLPVAVLGMGAALAHLVRAHD